MTKRKQILPNSNGNGNNNDNNDTQRKNERAKKSVTFSNPISTQTTNKQSKWNNSLVHDPKMNYIWKIVLILLVSGTAYIWFSYHHSLSSSEQKKFSDSRTFGSEIMDHVKNILSFGVRVPTPQPDNGTPGLHKTREYIISQFNSDHWHVESDSKVQNTVLGSVNFTNIIVTFKRKDQWGNEIPSDRKRIIVAAHYDSKLMHTEVPFLGATDSVVPCAMMLDFAHYYENLTSVHQKANYDLQFVFFDGEEAFVEWSRTDSIYGAKQLSERWEREDKLKSIHFLLLLDLIGTKNTEFYNYGIHFDRNTQNYFTQLSIIEEGLRKQNQLKTKSKYFKNIRFNGFVEDDHIPFYVRGVPVLHLIPYPFPDVWHTVADNWEALDKDTIQDLQQILVKFLLKQIAPSKV